MPVTVELFATVLLSADPPSAEENVTLWSLWTSDARGASPVRARHRIEAIAQRPLAMLRAGTDLADIVT